MKAALISLNFDTGEIHYQQFEGEDCINDAHDFKSCIVNDFPGSVWGVVADYEAKKARVAAYLSGGRTKDALDTPSAVSKDGTPTDRPKGKYHV